MLRLVLPSYLLVKFGGNSVLNLKREFVEIS
jgi:hypothetical protein